MKTFFTILALALMFKMSYAQSENSTTSTTVLDFADQMPEYSGGNKAMMDFLQQNLHYPQQAKEKGIEADIIASFIVNADGSISDIKIKEGDNSMGFNEEVFRVIQQMPKWKPATQSGVNVAVNLSLPVKFHLDGNNNISTTAGTTEKSEYVMTASGQKVYNMLETMPEFQGGDKEMVKFLNSNLKYPADAQENGVQGTELVQFIVNSDGTMSDPVIKHSLGKSCDEEVLRIVKMMPNWKPGMKDGVPVSVYYVLPVSFKLKK